MVFATLAFLGAFGADPGLLTYFADLSGPGLRYYVNHLISLANINKHELKTMLHA